MHSTCFSRTVKIRDFSFSVCMKTESFGEDKTDTATTVYMSMKGTLIRVTNPRNFLLPVYTRVQMASVREWSCDMRCQTFLHLPRLFLI